MCVFLLVFVAATKMLSKCCPAIKENFLFRKFFSKSLSNVSSDSGHKEGGGNFEMNHVFASYTFSFTVKLTDLQIALFFVA